MGYCNFHLNNVIVSFIKVAFQFIFLHLIVNTLSERIQWLACHDVTQLTPGSKRIDNNDKIQWWLQGKYFNLTIIRAISPYLYTSERKSHHVINISILKISIDFPTHKTVPLAFSAWENCTWICDGVDTCNHGTLLLLFTSNWRSAYPGHFLFFSLFFLMNNFP